MEIFGMHIPVEMEKLIETVGKLIVLIVIFSIAVPLGKKMISATVQRCR